MRVIAVVGANFGDEGKGRIVDQLASTAKSPVVVVRYNGGAQAGHTVVSPEGIEHIFGHFGSGTLVGSDTYLSEFFIANPFIYVREIKDMEKKGIEPICYVHPFTPLSTPFDMLINREVEKWRSGNRHGSCGYGVAETVHRLCSTPYKTFVQDALEDMQSFKKTVESIRDTYLPRRLADVGIRKPTDWLVESMHSNGLLEQYYHNLNALLKNCQRKRTNTLSDYETVIFEGAQGLCLDERHRFFPHVTRSKTGLSNVNAICKKLRLGTIEVVYVTRTYVTRHGAGPLPTEDTDLIYEDKTNIENEWQGKLRFGCLDIDLLTESIKADLSTCSLITQPSIAITCFDQIADKIKVNCRAQIKEIDRNALPALIADQTNISKIMISKTRHRTTKK